MSCLCCIASPLISLRLVRRHLRSYMESLSPKDLTGSYYRVPRPLPRVLPRPLPMPDTVLALGMLDDELLVLVLVLAPLARPLPLPLVPRVVPLAGAGVCLGLSSSSAFLLTSSRRRSASAARRAASCCWAMASFSISRRSCVAPFQFGLSIRRWLCSVWESIRVHVLRRVEALPTVFATV